MLEFNRTISVQQKHSVNLRYWLMRLFTITLISVLLFGRTVSAQEHSLLIVTQANKSFSTSISQHLESSLADLNISTYNIDNRTTLNKNLVNQYDMIITLGSLAAKLIHDTDIQPPVLNLLITEGTLKALKLSHNNKNKQTALILNQPLKRQFSFIKHLLGTNISIGSLLGPYSSTFKNEILQSAKQSGFKINVVTTMHEDQLISSLSKLIENNDMILAIPDPVIFNRKSIRGILLLTYRNNTPIIGFSKSYVNAGALAAIYSEPEQISRQASEIIDYYFKHNRYEKSFFQPKYFSVITNNKVAKALDITLKSERDLIEAINKDESK